MKRKVAMQKLKNPKQTEQSKMKKIGKKTKENRKNVGEEKEGEESTQKEMVDREEIARKKAERQKKREEQQKAKENKEREKAVKEKERAALMERDNRILAEMNSLARNLDVESKQPFTYLSDEEEYDVDRAEPMDDDEYFGGRDIISECSSYLHPPPAYPRELGISFFLAVVYSPYPGTYRRIRQFPTTDLLIALKNMFWGYIFSRAILISLQ